MNTLTKGSKGDEVKQLQLYLKNLGYNLQIDGIFGEVTKEIVIEFQKSKNLTPDGVVGNYTWGMLKGLFNTTQTIQTKRKINDIILHCSATPEGKDYTIRDIDKWHKQRGFSKIGYHYVIYRDGTINTGRQESEIGAHCVNHNSHSIGICYIGGLDATGKIAKDTRTDKQKFSLVQLVKKMMSCYNLNKDNIHCHNQYDKKDCPSFKIEDFKKEL